MNAPLSGARQAHPSWFKHLVAGAAARRLSAIVVPGPEVARALGLDLEAAGLRLSNTPRHASVLVLVGELSEGLKKAAAVAYAQMPRPRAIFAVGAGEVFPLPEPDVSVPLGQEDVASGVGELQHSFAEGAFAPEVRDFDVDAIRTQNQYVCPMHSEVVRGEPGSCPICGMDLVPREAAGDIDHSQMNHGHVDRERSGHEGMDHGGMDHDGAGREHTQHGDARAAREGEEHGDTHNEHETHEHGEAEPEEHGDHHGHEETGREDPGGEHGTMQHTEPDHGEHEHMGRGHTDHSGHEGMDQGQDHGHEAHDQAIREHPGRGGRDDADHGAMDHGDDFGGHEAHSHGETRHGSHEEHDPQGGAHHEDMEHEKAAEGHGSHEGMNHARMDSGEHAEHGGHDHMDHGDMGFMSMVEMTKGLPRSPDGLPMEWIEVPFGPLFPGLPGGLTLKLTLDGDTVAEVEAGTGLEDRVSPENLAGPAETFSRRLSRLDPLAPISYRVLALRFLEDAAGVAPDEPTVLARVGALERERAASHLGWLASFGYLLGYRWLERRAAKLQLALLGAEDAEGVSRLRSEAGRLSRTVERTPLLRRKLGGIGRLPDGSGVSGPVARARGVVADARPEEEAYRSLGFEPVVLDGDDALARLLVRLAEVDRSLDLVARAGSVSAPEVALDGTASKTGTAVVETPRGTARLRATLVEGAVTGVELDTPSTHHLELVEYVARQQELADALVGAASLDISPWEVAR